MMSEEHKIVEFSAPWGAALRLTSLLGTVVLIGVPLIVLMNVDLPPALKIVVASLPVLILFGAAAFMVLGYEVKEDALIVKRPGWTTRVPLAGLRAAEIDPEAMKRSIRVIGNGGLFAFSGLFWSKTLGKFRAYATDLERCVVLELADRPIVVSPDNPEGFLAELRKRRLLPE